MTVAARELAAVLTFRSVSALGLCVGQIALGPASVTAPQILVDLLQVRFSSGPFDFAVTRFGGGKGLEEDVSGFPWRK